MVVNLGLVENDQFFSVIMVSGGLLQTDPRVYSINHGIVHEWDNGEWRDRGSIYNKETIVILVDCPTDLDTTGESVLDQRMR